jgi:hypothetical protein
LVAAGFVDKDQRSGLQLWDCLAEGGPLPLHLGTLLFRGVKRFFSTVVKPTQVSDF